MQSFTSGNLHYTFLGSWGWSEEKYYINIFDEKLGIGYAKILRPYWFKKIKNNKNDFATYTAQGNLTLLYRKNLRFFLYNKKTV